MALTESVDPLPAPSPARRRLEAWLALPPGDRAELLDGAIIYKASPSLEHGDAVLGIAEQLGRHRGPPSGGEGGWWLSQDVDLYIVGQGVRPDLAGWRVSKHPTPPEKVNVAGHLGVYVTPPDWVCEVLSASTETRDQREGVKWRAYWSAGVEHYWIVDVERSQVTVYGRGASDFEPVAIAGRSSETPLPPFGDAPFVARRVFVMAEASRNA